MMKIENPETFRSNIISKIDEIIKDNKISRNIERGVFNFTLKESTTKKLLKKWENPFFVNIYLDRLKTIYTNIQYEPLKILIQSGNIKTSELAFMTHQEMRPDKWDRMIEEKNKRDKCKYETVIEAATDTFKCRKCKSNKCTYYQMQTRSADEPMTTFVSCLDCGCRWKC
jgi:DNA-directed RNA polymerase subunit M/transcription elongation factor TFIIS